MKKILAIHFSQSGQLTSIMKEFCKGLNDYDVDFIKIELEDNFPFPWSTPTFFDAMPETVLEEPKTLKPINYKHEQYDLIVLGYQPWFLSPSIPTTSLLKNSEFAKKMNNTPVVTIIGARNMWLNSQESVKQLILDNGGKLVGNIPLIDKNNNILSAMSILHWMLTGKKERKWGILPMPGVSEKDIMEASTYGQLLHKNLQEETLEHFQNNFVSKVGISISTNILFIEGRAKKLFRIWANLIKKKVKSGAKRSFWINFFKYYLEFALFIVSPIVLLVYNILIRPFTGSQIKRKKEYFCGIELIKE